MDTNHSLAESRALQRLEILLPGAEASFVSDPTDSIPSTRPPALCQLGPQPISDPPGYKRVSSKPLKNYCPLHEEIASIHPGVASLFEPTGIFHHVGSRLCGKRTPDSFETIWIHESRINDIRRMHPIIGFVAASLVTVFGIGHLPMIGALAASALTCLVAAMLPMFIPVAAVPLCLVAVCVASVVFGVLLESTAVRHFLDSDPREFVLDEVAGMALTLLFIPVSAGWPAIVLAFIAFRFFDVLKPGIQWIEKYDWPGVITWDDLLAGLYAGITIKIIFAIVSGIFGI